MRPSAGSGALRAGRVVCLALCGVLVMGFVASVVSWFVVRPQDIAYNAWSTPEGLEVLANWGIPQGWWIAYLVTVQTAALGVCTVAAFFVLRAEVSWFRLYLAFALVLWGTVGSDLSLVTDAMRGQVGGVGQALQGLGWLSLFMLAYLFPDGRFVPRWGRWFVVAWITYLAVAFGLAVAHRSLAATAETVLLLVLFAGGVAAQVYRYARVSGRLERQQTRWLLAALALWLALALLLALTPLRSLYDDATPAGLVTYAVTMPLSVAVATLIPASVAFAILRYRLYDIDLWISRGLLYILLTIFVIGTYSALVAAVGQIWNGEDTLPSAIAAAVIALAFNPVRVWVQQRVNRLMYGDRDDPYAALSRLSEQLATVAEPGAIVRTVVDTVSRALRVPYVAVTMGASEEIVASRGSRVPVCERFELTHHQESLGHLVVGQRGPGDQFSAGDRQLLMNVARHSGAALHAAQESLRARAMAADLQRVRERLVTSREEERRRISRDLHDSLGSALATQAMNIDTARSLLAEDVASADTMLGELKRQSQQSLEEVRQLARELRPPVLDELGLAPALTYMQAAYSLRGVEVLVHVPDLPPLPAAVEVAAYRIVEEALTNVVRHAGATQCAVELVVSDQTLSLSISDDGRGIAADTPAGVGTASIRERAEELGGTAVLAPSTAGGTQVSVRLPLTDQGTP